MLKIIKQNKIYKMEIQINKTKKLKSIQAEFQSYFPYLKIEFYNNAHSSGEGSLKKNTLDSDLTIGAVQKHELLDAIKIDELTKVSDIENAFAKNLGLSAQVFRKSGNLWLQTTSTDNWTLAEQNKMAAEKYEVNDEAMPDAMDRQELE
jgi:hypothetical protein